MAYGIARIVHAEIGITVDIKKDNAIRRSHGMNTIGERQGVEKIIGSAPWRFLAMRHRPHDRCRSLGQS